MADESIITRLQRAVDNLVELRIVTAIGSVKLGGGNQPDPDIDYAGDPEVILTKIDLVQGDIVTVFNPALMAPEFETLRAFHAGREAQGLEIVRKNIETVLELLKAARAGLLQVPQQAPSPQPSPPQPSPPRGG